MSYLDDYPQEVKNAAYYRRQVERLTEENAHLKHPTEAEILLKDLAEALDTAFISTWQTTSAWQNELDAALEYVKEKQL